MTRVVVLVVFVVVVVVAIVIVSRELATLELALSVGRLVDWSVGR